jgi:hypothetical protein
MAMYGNKEFNECVAPLRASLEETLEKLERFDAFLRLMQAGISVDLSEFDPDTLNAEVLEEK